MTELALPNEIHIVKPLGEGRRSRVYLAEMEGEQRVVKVYKQTYIDKYKAQNNVNIGEFEFSRNTLAYQTDSLKPFVAKPYKLLRPEQGYALAFVQEYIEGIWLLDFIRQYKGLPAEALQAGYTIVEQAAKVGLYDLDISPGNIQLCKNAQGEWLPKLYDFNLMPQYMWPPNPFMSLGFKLGLRSKNHRDYRSLKHWAYLSQQASKN